jgi:DNA-binding transcriptional LysR family regulator
MLDFRMETFLEVCHTLNYTHAARALNITQPAVWQHIHFLEDTYQTKLFEYRSRQLSLTPSGESLKQLATTMMRDEQELRKCIAQIKTGIGTLVIGVTRTAGEYGLAPLLTPYLATHPDIRLSVIEDDTQMLLSFLDEGRIDCALVEGFFDKAHYDWRVFTREPFICVCSRNHVFKKKPQHLSDLVSERLIVREEGSGTRAILEHLLENENLSISAFGNICTVTSVGIIKRLVDADCGVSFLYRTAVEAEIACGALQQVTLSESAYAHDFTFIWRKGSAYADGYRAIVEDLIACR